MSDKTAIIIGAGPAGLTAAYELLKKSSVIPIVIEQGSNVGGLSQTIDYKGNKIDIGGHRFFSKSDKVMDWWLSILPLEKDISETTISYQNKNKQIKNADTKASSNETVMLVRTRLSRILFNRRLFNYPLTINLELVRSLGLWQVMQIGLSYTYARIFPIKNEKTLEDFFINRFGKKLYLKFFKDYTEKVWGQSCNEIDASWGKQRIKSLSISKLFIHAINKTKSKDVRQKELETSLIEQFLYPKYGPGQMWQEVANNVIAMGGHIQFTKKVISIKFTDVTSIREVVIEDTITGERKTLSASYFISTMPVKELISAMDASVPASVIDIASNLTYRDFMTVGLLLNNITSPSGKGLPDNWIYVQEKDVKVGRIQIFNNWSPYMVKDLKNTWIGLEYFVNEGEGLWNLSNEEMSQFAINEMIKLGFINREDCIDSVVVRMSKAYPSYTGSYNNFDTIRAFTDQIANLFLVGRNGMHRYNNQDHSMLTAMEAVENIMNGISTKENIWSVNTEMEYHETKA